MYDSIRATQTELFLILMKIKLDSKRKFSKLNPLRLGPIQIRNELERRCRSL